MTGLNGKLVKINSWSLTINVPAGYSEHDISSTLNLIPGEKLAAFPTVTGYSSGAQNPSVAIHGNKAWVISDIAGNVTFDIIAISK